MVFRGRIRPKAYPVSARLPAAAPTVRPRNPSVLRGFRLRGPLNLPSIKKGRFTRSSRESQAKCELGHRLAGEAGGAQFTVTLAHSATGQFGVSRASTRIGDRSGIVSS